jgi:formylglycine-generating enzyme required for sulfatase activity
VTGEGRSLTIADVAASAAEVFYLDGGYAANFGWPRYASHQKDPTVVSAFTPGAASGNTEPFYMALREISNSQYRLFLEQTGAKPTTELAGWSFFSDQSDNLLIGQAQGQHPPCGIKWDKSAKLFVVEEDSQTAPVTWVTFDGARAYAEWLGGQLPTAGQHSYATRAGSSTLYPWGDELSDAGLYAHVRSAAWEQAAKQYNVKRDNPVEIAYPPVGAIKDFVRGKALDPGKTVHAGSAGRPVWPCYTTDIRPNGWGLYDMLGNVWEWCVDSAGDEPVICGGSCLAPPEYLSCDSKSKFEGQACDVGFRVIIPAR